VSVSSVIAVAEDLDVIGLAITDEDAPSAAAAPPCGEQ